MRVIVCGGRDYDDERTVDAVMSALDLDCTVVAGSAPGADTLAVAWRKERGLSHEEFPADWRKHGKAAGPIRNQAMLDAGADLVIAFPGGRGTADMVSKAREAGVTVMEVRA